MRAYLNEPVSRGGKLYDPIGEYLEVVNSASLPPDKRTIAQYMESETQRLARKTRMTGMVDRIKDGD